MPALSVDRAWLEEDRARRIAREACEKATVTIAAGSAKAELRPLIRHLCESGQLTAGLVLRALFPGNIALFEEALAELSGIPLSRVSALVHDRFGSGLRPLFCRASRESGIPLNSANASSEQSDVAGEQCAQD